MLYEVITGQRNDQQQPLLGALQVLELPAPVITSYSIHYTKLYDSDPHRPVHDPPGRLIPEGDLMAVDTDRLVRRHQRRAQQLLPRKRVLV